MKAALNLLGAAFIILILYFFNPAQHIVFIPCWFYELTGYKCPGCGGLRASHLILHGNFSEAFRYNILIFFFIPPISIFVINNFWILIKEKKLIQIKLADFWVYISLALIIIYWIIRNIINI